MEIYQFPKKGDRRKYYVSGSYPKVLQLYRKDDSMKMEEVKNTLGKMIGKRLNFNYLSFYSYTKGVNILNYIFTKLLEDDEVQFELMGIENIKGYDAIRIKAEHYVGKKLYYTSDIYLERESLAVVHLSVMASNTDLTKQFLGFKERTALWFLGIKVKVKKYYTKFQFRKTSEGFWAVDDFMLMFPVHVKKRKKVIDGYMNVGFRVDKNIHRKSRKYGYEVYQENEYLFDHHKPQSRFGDKLNYSIPILPIQKERLERIKVF